MKMKIGAFVILSAVFFGSNALAGYTCEDGSASCEVSYSEQLDAEMEMYPLWVDCSLDGELIWTSDGGLIEIPDESTLAAVCQSTLTLFINDADNAEDAGDTSSGTIQTACSSDLGTCIVNVQVAVSPDSTTASHALSGDCLFSETGNEWYDGEIDHIPTVAELKDMCRAWLADRTGTPAETEKDEPSGTGGCTQSSAGYDRTSALFSLLKFLF